MPILDLDDEGEQEVEEVKEEAVIKGQKHYLIKQEGWPTEYNLWVPQADIGNAKEAIQRFERSKKSKEARKPQLT